MDAQGQQLRAESRRRVAARAEMQTQGQQLRAEMQTQGQALRGDIETLANHMRVAPRGRDCPDRAAASHCKRRPNTRNSAAAAASCCESILCLLPSLDHAGFHQPASLRPANRDPPDRGVDQLDRVHHLQRSVPAPRPLTESQRAARVGGGDASGRAAWRCPTLRSPSCRAGSAGPGCRFPRCRSTARLGDRHQLDPANQLQQLAR